jgi:tripartite-type tricarboxylate transporter receptor subunit TctC
MIVPRPDHPAQTVDEFVESLKKARKPVAHGSVGVGSLYRVLTEDMDKQIGAKVGHAPYKGAVPMLQDIAGDPVDFTIFPYANS